MIDNLAELHGAVHQYKSFLDMMEALRLQFDETGNAALFEHLVKGPIAILEERSGALGDCLLEPRAFLAENPKLHSDLRFFVCLSDAFIAAYYWSAERGQLLFFAQTAAGIVMNLRAVAAEIQDFSSQQEAA